MVGRFAWKSKNSSGSIRATSSASSEAPIAPSAVLAALAASFQPENEATSTGDRSCGGSRSQTIGSIFVTVATSPGRGSGLAAVHGNRPARIASSAHR